MTEQPLSCQESGCNKQATRYVQEYVDSGLHPAYRQIVKGLRVPYCTEHAPVGAVPIVDDDAKADEPNIVRGDA